MSLIRKHFYLFILVLGTLNLQAQFDIPEKPNTETSVYDYVSLLSETQKTALENKLIRYADTTSTQIVVAIIGTTNGENIGLLTPRWAHDWGIGQNDKDNGVFILLARDDREIWISPGYGVEHKLTAGTLGSTTRNVIIPEFKKGDYYGGLDKGTDRIIAILSGTYKITSAGPTPFPFWIVFVFLAIVVCIILLIIFAIKKGGGKGGGKRSRDTDLLEAIILSRAGRKSRGSRWGGSWGGSSGSSWGGSSGGGFGGGFGGGGFSGGGAGGSW